MDHVICRYCQEPIGWEHWQLFEHVTCAPGTGPHARQAKAEEEARQREFRRKHQELLKWKREATTYVGR